MSILIFGKNGQLARALQRSLTAQHTSFSCYGRTDADLIAHPDDAAAIIRNVKPHAVINATAFTDVDSAEEAEEKAVEANILNTEAPRIMAASCKSLGVPFIHISTDYVFDGTKLGAYHPGDKRNPLNAYGRSKAAGERAVMAAGGQSLILRTSWVYDGTGKNFLTTMLRLAKTQPQLSLVNNQFGRPTYAGHLAEACLAALENMPASPAIYHVSNSGTVISWAGFAKAIFERANLHPNINLVDDTHFPRPAKRPANSHFDISDFERDFNHTLEPWEIGLELAFHEIEN